LISQRPFRLCSDHIEVEGSPLSIIFRKSDTEGLLPSAAVSFVLQFGRNEIEDEAGLSSHEFLNQITDEEAGKTGRALRSAANTEKMEDWNEKEESRKSKSRR
jgi:hypothetical protein